MVGDPRKRKTDVRPKILYYYDEIFQGLNPSKGNNNFWSEFFLLWAHVPELELGITKLSGQKLLQIKPVINELVHQCVIVIRQDQHIKAVNALQTLRALVIGLASKSPGGWGDDLIDVFCSLDKAEILLQQLIERLCQFLVEDFASVFRELALNFLLTVATSTDNINQNRLLEYLLLNSVFEPIVQLLGSPAFRQNYGDGAVLLLTLLVNYRKYDDVNPYIVKLSILDDELALNGYSYAICTCLSEHNFRFQQQLTASEPKGMLSTLTSVVGSMFVAERCVLDCVKSDESLLLAMYEAVHLNRNYITTLTNLPTEVNGEVNTSATADGNVALDTGSPTNLLVSFLTYCSVVMQDLKSDRSRNAAKLCAIILTCVAEDQYANSLMHDVNMAFRVPLYRAPMLHRRGAFDKTLPLRPLACTLLDLCVEFIVSHLMRNLPFELYIWILGVVHRVLCYQKKCRVRLQYSYRALWNALVSLLRFVVNSESSLVGSCDIFLLCNRVVTLLNLFVTFGDTFLPSPTTYDHLYYEIIRQHQTFDNLYSMILRYVNGDNAHKDAAVKLGNHLVNIRAIVSHFQPKIEHLGVTTDEEQVLEVVRANYDTLTLKLYESLDLVDRYNEKPRETKFFGELVKLIISETRGKISAKQVDHQSVISELSTIT